jgi:hypothetical protein
MRRSPRPVRPLWLAAAILLAAAGSARIAERWLAVAPSTPEPRAFQAARPEAKRRTAFDADLQAPGAGRAAPVRAAAGGDGREPDAAPDADARAVWIGIALDPRAELGARIEAVSELAPLADEAAFAALERLLAGEAPPRLAAFAAEQLGSSRHPRAFERLAALAAGSDPELAMSALRGLGRNGSPEAVGALVATVGDAARPASLREQALEALGGLPFADTRAALRDLLASPEATLALEIQVLEALADSTSDAAGLLLEVAATAPRAELRAAALDSLVALEDGDDAAAFVMPLVASESEPRVRGRLYDVLAFSSRDSRSHLDAAALFAAVAVESDPKLRLRGARLVARLVADRADPELAASFDERLVPWLSQAAREESDPLAARAAIDTLASAGTSAASQALGELAGAPEPGVAQAAARALARAERSQAGG